MALRQLSFDVRSNCDWNQSFTIIDYNAVLGQDVPHDFGGESLRAQFRPIVNGVIENTVALDLSTANGMLAIGDDPTAGQFSIAIPASAMVGLGTGIPTMVDACVRWLVIYDKQVGTDSELLGL
jgi:hypothetical protein